MALFSGFLPLLVRHLIAGRRSSILLLSLLLAVQAHASMLNAIAPEDAGMSSERLHRLDDFLNQATARSGYLGAVALIARHGKIVTLRAYGHRDLARSTAMTTDSIFRIYSMSKTITTVAVLMLMEQGQLALDDPIDRYLPEFAHPKVFVSGDAMESRLRDAGRAITIHDLLTHTAGFATGGEGFKDVTALVEKANLHDSASLQEYTARLARLPLATDPGKRFGYDGMQIVVLSRLVEVIAKVPFDTFLKVHIFDPLKMHDTGFSVPTAQRARIADIVSSNTHGDLVRAADASAAQPGTMLNPYPSGAGGLYSTATDFARFCQMLLNGGTLDGTVVLGRKTVESMLQNHLTQLNPPVTQFSAAEGFGLGGSIVLDAARRGRLTSVGAFGWSGAASTYYTIDPHEDLVAILLTQYLPRDDTPSLPKLSVKFYNLVYQALTP